MKIDTRNEVRAATMAVVAETFVREQSELAETDYLEKDLDADSMALVTLMIALDDEFDLEIAADQLPDLGDITIGAIVDYVWEKQQ